MKKISYLLLITFVALAMGACSKNGKIEKVATESLSKQMKNPDSFKVTSIEIREDTIPAFLIDDVQKILKNLSESTDKLNRYSGMKSDLFAEQTVSSLSDMNKSIEELKAAVKDYKPQVKDVAYIRYTAKTGIGADKQGAAIVIVEGDDPKVVGTFFVDDSDFMKMYANYKAWADKKLETNEFGKFKTDGLNYMEQFILSDEN